MRFGLKAAAVLTAVLTFGCQQPSRGGNAEAAPHSAHPAGHSRARMAQPRNVPAHVQTAEYLWSPTERETDPSVYAPYVTWAYPLYVTADRVHDAGIKSVWYVNPVMPQQGEYEYKQLLGTYASVQAKDCGGNPVVTYGGKGILADPRSPQAAAFYSDVIDWYIRAKIRPHGGPPVWDAFFIDNNGALYGANPLPCNYEPVAWGRAFDRAIARVHQPIITNSLSARDNLVPAYEDRLNASNIIGGMYEECFNNTLWTSEENSQILTVAIMKRRHVRPGPGWWCYLDNTHADSTTVIPQRLFAYASFLLTYDVNYSLFQESYTTQPSTFKVYPETGFVPLGPAIAPQTIGDLQTNGGAYVQSYSWCYYRGKLIGACEIAVNPTHGAAGVPNPQHFAHTMVIAGGGILDGGTVSFNGGSVATLDPGTAAILVP